LLFLAAFPFTVKVCGCSLGAYARYSHRLRSGSRRNPAFGGAIFFGDPVLQGAAAVNSSERLKISAAFWMLAQPTERNHSHTWPARSGREWGDVEAGLSCPRSGRIAYWRGSVKVGKGRAAISHPANWPIRTDFFGFPIIPCFSPAVHTHDVQFKVSNYLQMPWTVSKKCPRSGGNQG